MTKLTRRDFIRAASAASGAAACAGSFAHTAAQTTPGHATLSQADYTPRPDYPRLPKCFSEVTLTDTFWKPKVDVNAAVTIPLEVRKTVETERGLSGNVLEAAMVSLRTHPDSKVQARVDAA